MNYLIPILTLILGLIVGYFIGSSRLRSNNKVEAFANDAERIKGENITKLKEYLSSQTDNEINNEDVRELLKISDATACRYLDELEKEGLVAQVGSDGPKVYYKKN